jgi:hypothetical protein
MTACHGKARFRTRDDAKDRASRIRAEGGPVFKVYECPCYRGHWHLASQPGHATHLRRSADGPISVRHITAPKTTPEAFDDLFTGRDRGMPDPLEAGVCPTPWRVSHPTRAVAEKQRINDYFRHDATLYPVECRGGHWHLTDNVDEELPARKEPTAADVALLSQLDMAAFRAAVDADVKRTGPLGERLALRHPDNLTRWRFCLKALLREVRRQIAAEFPGEERMDGWHTKARKYEDNLEARLAECQALRARSQHHYSRAS